MNYLINAAGLETWRLRVDYQEFRWVGKLLDQLLVFQFKISFEAPQVARLGDFFIVQLNGFNQVITDIHH
jgi:hypothetical protein